MESFEKFLTEYYSNSGWDDVEPMLMGQGHTPLLPAPTIVLPDQTIFGKIVEIKFKQNPIVIILDNKTQWRLTIKQWNLLKSKDKTPKINSRVQIVVAADGTVLDIRTLPGTSALPLVQKELQPHIPLQLPV